MRTEKTKCPWCGHEIEKPKVYKGICEECKRPYRCMAFSYDWDRLKQKNVGRKEVPALYPFAVSLFMSGLLLFALLEPLTACWRGGRVFYGLPYFALLAVALYTIRNLLFQKQRVHLIKDVKMEEGSGEDSGPERGRRLFFTSQYETYYYHSRFLMEVLNPDTGIFYERCQVFLNLEQNMTAFVEIRHDTPEYLDRPGMVFNLYDEDGSLINSGITMESTGEASELYQIVIGRKGYEIKLDKGLYYVARMKLGSREEPFYLVAEDGDMLESLKTGRSVYEVHLFHHNLKPRELPIPTDFSLHQMDGTCITKGRLTYFFKQRFLISKNIAEHS